MAKGKRSGLLPGAPPCCTPLSQECVFALPQALHCILLPSQWSEHCLLAIRESCKYLAKKRSNGYEAQTFISLSTCAKTPPLCSLSGMAVIPIPPLPGFKERKLKQRCSRRRDQCPRLGLSEFPVNFSAGGISNRECHNILSKPATLYSY